MGKNKYGNVEKQELDYVLNQNIGSEKYDSRQINSGIKVIFTETGNAYKIDSEGNVKETTNILEISKDDAIIGTEISNYNISGTWELFYYGDIRNNGNNRIYLILKNALPSETLISEGYYGTTDFDGTNTFKTKFPAVDQGLLYKTYSNGVLHYSSERTNMKCTEYLLDSSLDKWKNFMDKTDGTGYAEYVIGAPTLELLVESYDKTITINDPSGKGYDTTLKNQELAGNNVWNHGSIYWVASPGQFASVYDLERVLYVQENSGNVDSFNVNHSSNIPCGFRPIVCLNSNIELVSDSQNEGKYSLYSE